MNLFSELERRNVYKIAVLMRSSGGLLVQIATQANGEFHFPNFVSALLSAGPAMNPRNFFTELQRRHVYKVGAAYAVAGWLLVQVVTQVFPIFEVSALAQRIIVLIQLPAGMVASIERLKIDPVWDPIRSDPGFQQLLKGTELIGPDK